MSENAFGTLMLALDNPLIVVTTAEAGERAGLPRRLPRSVEHRAAAVLRLAVQGESHLPGGAALLPPGHPLPEHDRLPLAELFGTQTGDTVDKFAGLRVTPGAGDAPVLADCPNWLVGRRLALLDEGGDHVCVITEPVAGQSSGRFDPLRLSRAGHLTPGHGSRERHHPPTERAASR